MVGRVGELLRLQADGIPLLVVGAVLAGGGGRQIVGSVQVHAGQCGEHFHADAGLRSGDPGRMAQAGVPDDVAVVVPAGLLQSRVVGLDVQPQRFFLVEIHGRACHGDAAAGGNAGVVHLQVGVGVHAHAVAQRGAAGMAVEVEVTVVGHVADRGGVCGGGIADHQAAVHQLILDLQVQVAGETVGAVGAVRSHRHTVPLAGGGFHVKDRVVEPVQAAVQAVAVLVGRHMYDLLIQRELRPADAVGKTAYGCAHAVGVQFVVGRGRVAQHYIHGGALAVFHQDLMDKRCVGQQVHLDLVVFQHGALDGDPRRRLAEFSDGNRHRYASSEWSASGSRARS